ncbi:MAG: CsgG/HfaB family protein [Spirochaetia bacterium]|jgi:hypothetical protein|nr:CsgG/HfaB family protein [Spirochaetia bacterium]
MAAPPSVAVQKTKSYKEVRKIGGFMKKSCVVLIVGSVLLIGLLDACASTAQVPYRSLSEVPNVKTVGIVQAIYEFQFYDGTWGTDRILNERAYSGLLKVAKNEYTGNIDIRDITWSYGKGLKGGMCEYLANGKVVLLDGGNTARAGTGIEGALARAAEQTLKNIPQKSKIAIVYITAQDKSTTDYIAGELEFIWVNEGYIITDRSQLDRLRREQNFQMSGEVDDETAVSIGRFAGASIIVTGSVDGEGNLRRLRLRALDTQTAQVVGVASERL